MSEYNPYDVLQVPRFTSDETTLKKAYRKQVGKYHTDRPDKMAELHQRYPDKSPDEVIELANQLLKKVNSAWELLSDPKSRATYDKMAQGQSSHQKSSSQKNTHKNKQHQRSSSSDSNNSNGNFVVSGGKNIADGCVIKGSILGSGHLNVGDSLSVRGSIHSGLMINVGDSAKIGGDVSSGVILKVGDSIRISGNVSSGAVINAGDDVTIHGDVGADVVISAGDSVKIKGNVAAGVVISAPDGVKIKGHKDESVIINGKIGSNNSKSRRSHSTYAHSSSNSQTSDGSRKSSMNINGIQFESDGNIAIKDGAIFTKDAQSTSIKTSGSTIEILGADIVENIVSRGEVKLNGKLCLKFNGAVNILEICPEIQDALSNVRSTSQTYNFN